MSEDYTPKPERTYSAFLPIFIFLAAFAILSFYQLYGVMAQRSYFARQDEAAAPDVAKALAAQNRLVNLMNDLIATSKKDSNAALIIREAKQAGILRDRPAAGTNAAPANP